MDRRTACVKRRAVDLLEIKCSLMNGSYICTVFCLATEQHRHVHSLLASLEEGSRLPNGWNTSLQNTSWVACLFRACSSVILKTCTIQLKWSTHKRFILRLTSTLLTASDGSPYINASNPCLGARERFRPYPRSLTGNNPTSCRQHCRLSSQELQRTQSSRALQKADFSNYHFEAAVSWRNTA